MTSITTFAYGITVRAADLVGAAAAWPQLEPVFHFFDLVYLRRKRGSLAGAGITTIVPVEVWDRVKRYLVALEKEDAVDSIARAALHREDCGDPECAELDELQYTWGRFFNISIECVDCDDKRSDFVDDFVNGKHGFHKRIHDLVATFGLAHPLDFFIRVTSGIFADDCCVALIAMPSRIGLKRSQAETTLSATSGGGGNPDEHSIVDVDLTLPLDSDLRFLRFVRTFSLEVVDATELTLRPTGPRTLARARIKMPPDPTEEGLPKGWSTISDKVTDQIKPRWKLYTTSSGEAVG
ncbi:hypothetical protein JCM5353_004816 [Sporobolomyces roseus]